MHLSVKLKFEFKLKMGVIIYGYNVAMLISNSYRSIDGLISSYHEESYYYYSNETYYTYNYSGNKPYSSMIYTKTTSTTNSVE